MGTSRLATSLDTGLVTADHFSKTCVQVGPGPTNVWHLSVMRTKFLAGAALSLSLLFTPACGGFLSQAISVQKAVESKNYDVQKVGVAKDGSGKTVTVYMNQKFDDADKQEISDTAQGVVPDANTIKVVKAEPEASKTTRPDTRAN